MSFSAGELPAGQRAATGFPVLHYGPIPSYDKRPWSLRISGATASAESFTLSREAIQQLPHITVQAGIHCVKRWSVSDRQWTGISGSTIIALTPPEHDVKHVVVWAEYGYSATIELADLQAETTVLALECDGEPLTPEHGYPLRLIMPHLYGWKGPKWLREIEYVRQPRRGFWEERGYHLRGSVSTEERYSYQE